MTMQQFTQKYIVKHMVELVIVGSTIVLSVLLLSTVTIATGFTSDATTSSIFGIVGLVGVAMMVFMRYVAAGSLRKKKATDRPSLYIWLLPIGVTIAMLPWLLQGILTDQNTNVVLSIVLWLLITYAALLLGILATVFILAPIELLARGIYMLVRGNKAGVFPVAVGLYGGILVAFILCGAYALDDLPPAWLSWGPIIFALFGIPSAYTVENETLLWIARLCGFLLIVGFFVVSMVGRDVKQERLKKYDSGR